MWIFKELLTANFFPEIDINTEEVNLTCSWRWRQDQEEDSGKFM